jgi:hypothetical protein
MPRVDESNSERAAKRVLIVVSRKSPHWIKAWTSSEELIVSAIEVMLEKQLIPSDTRDDPSTITFLAKERWDWRTFVVFDMFHDAYDPDSAHLPGHNDLPVISAFFGQKVSASIAGRPMENKVNSDLRALHNVTGLGSRPPFVVDHADGKVPFYSNPRNAILVQANSR